MRRAARAARRCFCRPLPQSSTASSLLRSSPRALQGIRFRGFTIPELQEKLPPAVPGGEPTPEGLLWLLITGEVPTAAQAASVTAELHARSKLPAHVAPLIKSLPKGMHPMTQVRAAARESLARFLSRCTPH